MISRDKTWALSSAVLAAFAIGAVAQTGAAGQACEKLIDLKLQDTTITTAESVAAGAFTPPRPQGAQPVAVAFCRVAGSIKPTSDSYAARRCATMACDDADSGTTPASDSDIRFELWLPASGWTGRYESVGNGGFAGNIRYDSMIGPLLGGSAVASTDDGHNTPGANWAFGHPQKIIDYGYRAVHVTAETSKAITAAFYGTAPKFSYFVGCSKGGGEAFMEAQRYPEDFDGIVGAANANLFTDLFSSFAWDVATNVADKAGYISADDVGKIGTAIVAACDTADGVKDGVINNPLKCHPDLSKLPLTPAQLKTYQTIHDGMKTSQGKQIYPGQVYGSEIVGWRTYITGPSYGEALTSASQSTFGNGFLANFVYQDPNWDGRKFDADKTPADAEKAVGRYLNATDLNFTEFKKRGGKYIQWHGFADALVTPLGSIDYYRRVVAAQGQNDGKKAVSASGTLDSRALARTQEFYRLFLAPGVGHCAGGPGANQFGQAGGNGDPQHDIVVALQQWVEKGVAPTRIIATKYVDDDRTKGVAMTRPLCLYPQAAKYKGSGDTNDAANFVCAAE
jgi:feruloyl esterase